MQDKQAEISFFNRFAAQDEYNVFTEASSRRLIRRCLSLAAFPEGGLVADLGCGSGIFTALLQKERPDLRLVGLDISHSLITLGTQLYPDIRFVTGDVENLPFPDNSLSGMILSGVVHHFPILLRFGAEVYRVLRPGGTFVAFDPNRRNPFMYLYRDCTSPFYSSRGVTPNERPILAEDVAAVFSEVGFLVKSHYLSGISYRYVASSLARMFLPIYNLMDNILFNLLPLKTYSAFILTQGVKNE